MYSVTGKGDLFVTTEEWMRDHALVMSTIIKEDVPGLVVVLQHPLEHLQSLGCGTRPPSWGNGARWQRRSWEERIERRLVGHASSKAGFSDTSINQFYTLPIMYDDAVRFECDKSFGQYRSVSRTDYSRHLTNPLIFRFRSDTTPDCGKGLAA